MHSKTIKKPTNKAESIWETEARLKREAQEISKSFVHIKKPKYLLKN